MTATQTQPDFAAIKSRQQATWSSGDYAVIGTTLAITGELLCEAVDLRAGQQVLDVAAGNGNATIAAARRWAEVTSTDYVPALLERGRAKAEAERLSVAFQQADAEELPFADASFDVVLSVFGVMFTPNQEQAASELLRVCLLRFAEAGLPVVVLQGAALATLVYPAPNLRPIGDIDLLVHFKKGASLFDIAGLGEDLSELLKKEVDIVPDDSLHWFIRDRILQEAVPL